MKTANELKQEIGKKRSELENLQREEKIDEGLKAADELNKLVDEYNIAVAKERAEFENMLNNSEPLSKSTGTDDKVKLRNRAFNKLVLGRGRLTDEEKRAYFNDGEDLIGQRESVDEKGGYLVPEEQLATIREYRKAYAQLKS